jgi:heptosyltransferase II
LDVLTKILIVKIGAIGDVALSLSMLDAFQGSEITWVVGGSSNSLLQSTGRVLHLITVDELKLVEGSLISKTLEVLKVWRHLFFKKFDLVITAHPDPRYRLLSLLSFKKEHRYFIRGKNAFPVSGVFHGLHYLQLALGRAYNDQQILWPKLDLPSIDHLVEKLNNKHLIIISAGGSKDHQGKKLRMWPIEYYVRLAQLLEKFECQIALVGMIQDEWIVERFFGINVLSFVGKTTLLELIALLKRADGVITHDGGSLHLARLVGCKLCGVFGPSSPKDFSLDNEDEIMLWGGRDLKCCPCYNGETFARCSHQSCMKQIYPEDILAVLVRKWGLKKRENSNCS